jgi:hypothetical protein
MASTTWHQVAAATPEAAQLDFVDISDNQCTVGVLSRCRSSIFAMNRLCRKKAALEMASGVQLASTWVDTRHQPADGGTRCDALGRLHLDRPRWTHLQLVVEIFAGCARITTECEAAGLATSPPWDILRGAQFDLRSKKNIRALWNLISSGHLAFVWWGTPCSSFSCARRWGGGPPPLRDGDNPSLPRQGLEGDELLKVLEGNQLADVTAFGIKMCAKYGIYTVIENPMRSKLWVYPPIVDALSTIDAQSVQTDFCGFGMPWNKATLLKGNLPNLRSLERKCCPWTICRFTQKLHTPLNVRKPGGVRPKDAEAYPPALCKAVASLVYDAVVASPSGVAAARQR